MSCDQFQLSSWPNFGSFYQKLVTWTISIVILPNFGNFFIQIWSREPYQAETVQKVTFRWPSKKTLDWWYGTFTFSGKKTLHWQENLADATFSWQCNIFLRFSCICKKISCKCNIFLPLKSGKCCSVKKMLHWQDFLVNAKFSCKCNIFLPLNVKVHGDKVKQLQSNRLGYVRKVGFGWNPFLTLNVMKKTWIAKIWARLDKKCGGLEPLAYVVNFIVMQ